MEQQTPHIAIVGGRMTPLDEAACWEIISARDKAYMDGFFYGVITTGIYCRPGCAARLPLRKNVRYYATRTKAIDAGLRPCKRCFPDVELRAEHPHKALIVRACRMIEMSETEPSLAELAAMASLSTYHFHRIFKTITGLTPKGYALANRQKKIRQLIKDSPTITKAVYEAGYNSPGWFYAQAEQIFGMTPEEFKRGGRLDEGGIGMKYAIGRSQFGLVLVAITMKGIAAILMGDFEADLVEELTSMFPHASMNNDDDAFTALVEQVISFVEQSGSDFNLPLDIRGTAFQQLVWQALRDIRAGTTASYSQIAEAIGRPTAARAVARACASNRLAVAIPCHRVVRGDGSLSGYRWGVERKKELLENEQLCVRKNVEMVVVEFGSGAVMLPGFALEYDAVLVEEIERIADCANFRHMMTPWGKEMSVAITNCGEAGWVSDKSGYRYDRVDPLTGRAWPLLPEVFLNLAMTAAQAAGYDEFMPNSCLINCYKPGAQMGLHQDKNEGDYLAPIVSVSLGLPAKFLFGGLKRSDKPQRFMLEHGDVCVWGGVSRLAYHGVDRLKEGGHPLTGECRYNLTFRQTSNIISSSGSVSSGSL